MIEYQKLGWNLPRFFKIEKVERPQSALESLWKISAHFQPQTAIIFLFYDCLFHSSFHSGWLMFTKSTQMHQKADKTSTSATPSSHKLMFKEDSDSYKDRAGQAVTLFIWAEIIFFTSCVSYYAFPLTCLTLPKSVTLVRLALWVQWNFSQQVAKFLILYNTFLSLKIWGFAMLAIVRISTFNFENTFLWWRICHEIINFLSVHLTNHQIHKKLRCISCK